MSNPLTLTRLAPVIKELLAAGQDVSFFPDGTSMLPYLHPNTDKIILRSAPAKLCKYDIPLYIRANGSLILHRIVDTSGDTYTMCGDNQAVIERDIKSEQIVGVVKGFYRGERFIVPRGMKYFLYCRTLCLRRQFIKLKFLLNKKQPMN